MLHIAGKEVMQSAVMFYQYKQDRTKIDTNENLSKFTRMVHWWLHSLNRVTCSQTMTANWNRSNENQNHCNDLAF